MFAPSLIEKRWRSLQRPYAPERFGSLASGTRTSLHPFDCRPIRTASGRGGALRRVTTYCLTEFFRAWAPETGFVNNNKCLPVGVDIGAYRSVLAREAEPSASLPSIATAVKKN